MKNLIYFILILLISFACDKKEGGTTPETPEKDIKSIKVDLQTSIVFVAKIMGKNLVIEEGQNGWEDIQSRTATSPSFKIEFVEGKLFPQATKATISTIIARISTGDAGIVERINIIFPTIDIDDYNDINKVRQMVKIGQKNFQESAISETQGVAVIYNQYSSAYGKQDSKMEIVEVKESKSSIDPEAIVFHLLIQVPYCKLYDRQGRYAGDIEDMRFATQFHYKPYKQPE